MTITCIGLAMTIACIDGKKLKHKIEIRKPAQNKKNVRPMSEYKIYCTKMDCRNCTRTLQNTTTYRVKA